MEAPVSRTKLLQEIRKMRFEEAYVGWQEKRLTQEQAAEILGVTDRSFRRYAARYEAEGLEGLIDRRIEVMSARGAPADEVMRLVETYRSRYEGWNVAHFYGWYRDKSICCQHVAFPSAWRRCDPSARESPNSDSPPQSRGRQVAVYERPF